MFAQTISRIRRNHGLEHATIHVLSEKYRNFSAQGNSDYRGFHLNIYGDIDETDVATAVNEAYTRMKNGEKELAVHPNCGTVLLTTATMATLAAQTVFAVEGRRQGKAGDKISVLLNGLPSAILAVVMALIVSRPVGIYLQKRYTTEGDLGDLQIVTVKRVPPSLMTRLFQILLTSGRNNYLPKSYKVVTSG